ncbi:hypothetical protein FOZ61_005264 [Perkinsus olseni]|uniref:Uncharacterized protein n=1 Tax=Perkinsus olseni TaxID=32597 RepID=A0A7J6LHM4_PEROL|nr:hypothetical protein FOZ61_005264 [Perkinsus olseni]
MVSLAHWALPCMTIMTRWMTVRAASKGSGGRRRPSREPAECASLDHTDTLKEQVSKLSNGLTKLTEKVTKMSEKFSKLTEKVATLTKQVSEIHDGRRQGETSEFSHNMPEPQSLTLQTEGTARTKSLAQDDASSARVSELYNENKRLREEVKKLDTRVSGLLSFNEQVETEPGRCTVRRLDSFISVSNDMSRHRVLWEINTKVEFKGDSEEILRKMGRLYPIGHLLKEIYKALEHCMYTLTCSQLIETIEQTPPKGYKPGKDWMKKFISNNMNDAVSHAKRYGKEDDSSGSDKYGRLLNQMSKLNDRMSKLIHFTQKIKVRRGECEARYIDDGPCMNHERWASHLGSNHLQLAKSLSTEYSTLQFMGGAGIRFWDGDRESAAEIRGTFEEIKNKFAEIYPIAHLVDTIKQELEDWDMHEYDCSSLINTIQETPPPSVQPGRNWMADFLVAKMDRAWKDPGLKCIDHDNLVEL